MVLIQNIELKQLFTNICKAQLLKENENEFYSRCYSVYSYGWLIFVFIIYVNVFVLNLFYHLFTGKHLKIYEKFSSCIGSIIKQFFDFVDTLF